MKIMMIALNVTKCVLISAHFGHVELCHIYGSGKCALLYLGERQKVYHVPLKRKGKQWKFKQ